MKHVLSTLCVLLFPLLAQAGGADVVIENAAVRLVIGADGAARSLIHKSTGEECLAAEVRTPICAITQYRPYDNENFLIYPAKPRVFPACRVERRGNRLYVGFEDTYDIAVIRLDIEDDYIGFSLERVDYRIEAYGVKRQTEIDEFALLRLPLRPRAHFGEWLNVVWDDRVAVNLLGTHPGTRIDAFPTAVATTLYAGLDAQVGLFGPGAALVVSSREGLLPAIGQIERDYDLPRGVESRRDGSYRCSYYSLRGVTPENIDAHIEYARRGGFRTMMVYYVDFARSCGHYGWREEYPGGMEDLRYVTDRIRAAGMIPGLHFHYSKVGVNDPYINGGHPDTRMNSVCELVLAEPAGAADTVLVVEGNTQGLRREEGRRLLHLGDELISYADCTTRPPYMLTGCRRGLHNSQPAAHAAGSRARLLDVDDWPLFVRIDQNTGIQREIAGRLGRIYAEAGFRFVYFDGAEDVPMPYWYNVSRSQSVVYDALRPAPLFAEGALKSHFGWHILSRGNAFDIFPPEYIRPAMKKYTLRCAARNAEDFTAVDFGWVNYLAPGGATIGMQPDMYEYIYCKALAWDAPVSLVGNLEELRRHPRTEDNLRVMERWERAKLADVFTPEQKERLKDPDREFFLFEDSQGRFELYPCRQLTPDDESGVRAFLFRRGTKSCILYWHTSGEDQLRLTLPASRPTLTDDRGRRIAFRREGRLCLLPAAGRAVLELDLPEEEAERLFLGAVRKINRPIEPQK